MQVPEFKFFALQKEQVFLNVLFFSVRTRDSFPLEKWTLIRLL